MLQILISIEYFSRKFMITFEANTLEQRRTMSVRNNYIIINKILPSPCVDTLLVVRGLASYRDSERCAGKAQPSRRSRVRVAQRSSSLRGFA